MPNLNNNIFNRKKLAYLISKHDFSGLDSNTEKFQIINQWLKLVRSQSFITTKETALQGGFLNDIFGTLLGYTTQTQNPELWNLNHEQVTSIDGKFADGALGFISKESSTIRAVIELKDPRTNLDEKQHRFNDLRTPVEQAFSYQHKIGRECRWVIVSNFREIRLYHASSSTEYEIFYIDELDNSANLKKFYYLMNFENLVSLGSESVIDSFYKTNQQDEQDISKQFYTVFKQVRINLFNHLKENNPEIDELILLEKTQKLLDRFIFVCFCEDNHLLPDSIFKQIVQNAEKSFSFSNTKVWNEVRGLFHAINEGSPAHNINKFNGGLFFRDETLDGLVIKDSILKEMSRITDYDFDSDIDVNILGHIFEQSINDIEELKSRISGDEFDKKASKRKKDGIYYTPEYITKYIVENAIGGWLEDRKQEIGYFALPELKDSDYKSISTEKGKTISSENVKRHLNFWNQYKEYLMSIKVLDPACGSGAFLNQAFNYLFAEGRKVNETIAALTGGQREVFQLDRHILSNNLYGVDLNNESVEITKLSLWLKTANKYSELTALDNNIKCGNSLIDDPAVAGFKAFNWFTEFPSVFPGYRDYSKKYTVPKFEHVTWDEIKERMLQEPEVQYNAGTSQNSFEKVNAKTDEFVVQDSAYSYGPGSKGYEKHGFDVIIGNPPYGADSKELLEDSYIMFYKLGFSKIKSQGYIGFITPDTWTINIRNSDFRKLIRKKYSLVDIYDVYKPFEDAKDVWCHIVIIKNKEPDIKTIYKVHREFPYNQANYQFFAHQHDLPETGKSWSIYLNLNLYNDIIKKITLNSIITKLEWHRGFSFTPNNMNITVEETIRPVIGGEDIGKYKYNWNKKYLINSYIKSQSSIHIVLNSTKLVMQRIRTNSSDYNSKWIIATYIEKGLIPNDSLSYLIDSDSEINIKAVLAIINSNLINFYYKLNYTDKNVKPIYLNKIPIPKISLKAQLPFIELADIMLEKNKELQQIKNKFLDLLQADFNLEKISNKLQNWHELKWSELTSELKKQKIELKGELKEDWKERFDRLKVKAVEIMNLINTTDRKIDLMVYELYGLTEEEIRIVEGVE
ncbi:MAG: DNA methyltransferase [Candidatus Kapabacteria bacterium]|nr:DNA methyltransferase [Candidatus Kapabacteria bacterium]